MHDKCQSLGMYIVICMLVLHIEYKLIINQSGGWGCDSKNMYLSGQVFRFSFTQLLHTGLYSPHVIFAMP